jgi:hypothetical protein
MFQRMKLGRNAHDPAQLARMPQLSFHALAKSSAPPSLDRSALAFNPQMFGNDGIGDCSSAGIANALLAGAALHNYGLAITTDDVIRFYSGSCGYNPSNPSTDRGGVLANVLTWQAQNGFAAAAIQDQFVGDFANIDVGDLNALRNVAAACGAVYLGVDLAVADQVPINGVWDTDTPADAGDPTPGSWGGHCIDLWDYDGVSDTSLCRLATWGTLHPATWRWVRSRLAEAHMIMWRQIGGAIDGFDYDRLKADAQSFIASPIG